MKPVELFATLVLALVISTTITTLVSARRSGASPEPVMQAQARAVRPTRVTSPAPMSM
jgi:hypothetical protein